MLACFLYRALEVNSSVLDDKSVDTYLQDLKPKFLLCPAQKACIAEALKFLPPQARGRVEGACRCCGEGRAGGRGGREGRFSRSRP